MARKKKKHKRFTWLIYLIIFLIVLIILSLGDRGFLKQIQAYKKQSQLQEEIKELQAEKKVLEEKIDQLDKPEIVEKVAREEYGMAKEGEEVYKVIPADKDHN
ncbi:MAG: septum formation initiator family protein [bacterium]